MIRKFKTLGLALVAVLALTTTAASVASAAGKYTAEVENTTGTAESVFGNDTFTTEGGNVECKSHFEGTVPGFSASTLTVKAKYTECKAFGFPHATVQMNSCDYRFNTPTGSGANWTATVNVICSDSTKPITIAAGNCEITVGSQGPLNHVLITNTAGDVDVQADVKGVHYTVVKDGFLCPFNTKPGELPATRGGATYKQHKPITFDSTNGSDIHIG
jgi:hypothetical protein